MLHRVRCSKYWLEGDKKGQTEIFVENLNGYPDNIRYNGRDIFWIGLVSVGLLTPSFVSQSFCIIIFLCEFIAEMWVDAEPISHI